MAGDEHVPGPPEYRIQFTIEIGVSMRTVINGERSLRDAELTDELRAALVEFVADPRWADLRPEVK